MPLIWQASPLLMSWCLDCHREPWKNLRPPEEATNIAVYDAVNRSVVNINTKATVTAGLFLLEVPSEGAGSGIVLDKAGHILTNYHVVEGAKEIQVLLYDGSSHAGTIRGMREPEARMLLLDLNEFATQPQFVYTHVWSVGDLVMWDNRCTMHRAREYYKKATKLDPQQVEAWLGIGITLQNEERWFEALHYLRKALELEPTSPEAWFAIGDAEYHLDNYAAAETAYRKVIELEPENKEIWLEYSHLMMVDDRPDDAMELIRQGLQHHAGDAELLYRLACYQYSTGNVQASYATLEEALTADPAMSHTIFEYSPSLENDRNILEIIEQFKNRP